MGGREWGLSNPQQAADRAAAGRSSLTGEAHLRKKGGRRPIGPTNSHTGEARDDHKAGGPCHRCARCSGAPWLSGTRAGTGRRLDAGCQGAESCSGEQI